MTFLTAIILGIAVSFIIILITLKWEEISLKNLKIRKKKVEIVRQNKNNLKNYETANFTNKDSNLENFIIRENFNEFDLQKLAELNGIQLHIPKAWYPLTIELVKELGKIGWNKRVGCIKEKYARLAFYVGEYGSDIHETVQKYADKSERICQQCGERGEIRSFDGWDSVHCRKHYLENRGKFFLFKDGFGDGKKVYKWKDVRNIFLKDYNEFSKRYDSITIKFFTKKVEYDTWMHDEFRVSSKTIGFGNLLKFLSEPPNNFLPNVFEEDKMYFKLFKEPEFCEICGYKAVYNGKCECCENQTWENYCEMWKKDVNDETERINHIKYNQLFWMEDEGEYYEKLQNNYSKNPAHKVYYTEEDLKDLLNTDDALS